MNEKEEFLKRHISLTIKKAYRLLKTAEIDFGSGDYDSATSRAYYAIFHMMEGTLVLKGLSFSKHSAVISQFNLHFIKPGVFPKEFSRAIESLFEQRQIGDYDVESNIDKDEAGNNIKTAYEIVKSIEKFLKNETD